MSDRVRRSKETGPAGGGSGTKPRALIHRKILDVAGENPDASLEAIADEVSGASLTFVERVLEEYGDPARSDRSSGRTDGNGRASRVEPTDANRDGSDAVNASRNDPLSVESSADDGPTETGDTSTANAFRSASDGEVDDSATITDASQLSERQRETLVAVAERPTATQAEIAAELGVSRATVSKRLTDLDGFEWPARREFVERVFDYRGGVSSRLSDGGAPDPGQGRDQDRDQHQNQVSNSTPNADPSAGDATTNGDSDSAGPVPDAAGSAPDSTTGPDSTASPGDSRPPGRRLAELESRLADLERRIEEDASSERDPELAHKIVHACMDAEYVTTEEELEVVSRVIE